MRVLRAACTSNHNNRCDIQIKNQSSAFNQIDCELTVTKLRK